MFRRTLAVCLTALILTPGAALAQLDLGVQGSWADDADFGLGGRVTLGLPTENFPLEAIGSFDYFFPDGDVDYWEINANVAYLFPLEAQPILPYAGAGLNIAHVSVDAPGAPDASDTEVGLNLLGGVKFPVAQLTPYGEVRIELSGGEQFVLTGGVSFNVGPGIRRD